MVLDIGCVLEFFGGIAIVATVSLPSVALSTLSRIAELTPAAWATRN
jgi:hypothetical protein